MKRPFGQHEYRGTVPGTITMSKQDADAIRYVVETLDGDGLTIDLPREVARQLDLLAEG